MLNKNNERELAYVVIINDVTPIAGYDRVELAHIGGWTVVVGKGEFSKGDPAIYFEIDSKLPEVEPFVNMEFLTKKHYKIKTQKMCKSISQGLIMSAKNFGWDIIYNNDDVYIQDNDGNKHYANDESRFLTQKLNVTYYVTEDNYRKSANKTNKYSSMAKRHGKLFSHQPFRWLMKRDWGRKLLFIFFGRKKDSRGFPDWVKRTDEERCLIPQTKVLTDKGYIQIGKIVNQKLAVKVASVNDDGTISYKKILDYQKFHNNDDVITIGYPYSVGVNGRLKHLCCTPDHKILTQRGYIEAKDITLDDILYMPTSCYGDDCLGALYGMIIGDGHIYNDKRSEGNLRFVATNGEDQLEYLKYKKRLFNDDGKIVESCKSPYGLHKKIYHWFINTDGYLTTKMREDIYINGKKTITENAIDKLNDIGLALWYMDDGCISFKESKKQNCNIRLNTQALSKEENELLCDFLKNKYGIECHVSKEKRKGKSVYYHIHISPCSVEDFLRIVTPYMHKSMAFKTIPSLEHLIETKSVLYEKHDRIVGVPVKTIEWGQHKSISIPKNIEYVYDIEVEDNHNFIADGIVVHNCQNIPWILDDKEPFIATEKIDGTSTTFTLKKGKGLFGKDEFLVCSRNVCFDAPNRQCYYDTNVYLEMAEKYKIETKMRKLLKENFSDCEWITIQGETYGGNVQKRDYSTKEHNFMAFNFVTSKDGRWNTIEMRNLLEYKNGIPCVPVIDDNYILPNTVDELLDYATGESVIDGGMREGIVFRSLDGKKSFKAVSNEYLIKFH